jgi:hypothetical protein
MWIIKSNMAKSRTEYLNIRIAQEKYRKNYLESIDRLYILSKEQLKKRCKRCNATFGKEKIKLIDKVEYFE